MASKSYVAKGVKNHIVLSDRNVRFFGYLLEYKENWLRDIGMYDFVNTSYFSKHYHRKEHHRLKWIRTEYQKLVDRNDRIASQRKNNENAVWDLF